MTYLCAAGGTAGHVNPMLATAAELTKRGHEVIAIGTATGLEADLVPSAGYELVTIEKVPFPRKPSLDLLRLPGRLKACVDTITATIKATEAKGLIGYGGYVSAPAYIAARRAGIPVIIHEQNARPGLANKLGARWAAGLGLTFASTPLRAKGITRVTGLPLRPAISALARDRADAATSRARREAAAERFGLDPDRPVILVTGGSSGATSINTAVASASLTDLGQVLHITGKGKMDDIASAPIGPDYVGLEYVEDMEEAYALADMVVSRSGAGMVGELAALTIPALVIPLAIGNGEQYLNAESYIDSGAFFHLANDEVTPQTIRSSVETVMNSLAERIEILSGSGVSAGASNLADLIEEVS